MKAKTSLGKWMLIAGFILAVAALSLVAFMDVGQLRAAGENVVTNGDFQNGTNGWTCKICKLTTGNPSQNGAAAQMTTTKKTGRAQLMQNNITLQPNTTYELSFWARSEKGQDLRVSLQKAKKPGTNYGIKNKNFNLSADGQVFTLTFTTTGFNQPVSDARLRLQAVKGKGITYSIDNVTLVALDGPPPGNTATPPAPTATPKPGGTGDAILIYDWNKPITEAEGGFAMDKTSQFLKQDWTKPINYADGQLYFRAQIKGIPKNQPGLKLGFCFWQKGGRENCKGQNVAGVPGTVATWNFPLHNMWKKNGVEVDWSSPRVKMGFSVRDAQNDPVSNKTSSNWGGNDPKEWYPMNLRFQVVLVPKGGTFPGWNNFP